MMTFRQSHKSHKSGRDLSRHIAPIITPSFRCHCWKTPKWMLLS